MLHKQKSLARLLTASLAIAAIAPAAAGAVPIIDNQSLPAIQGQAVAAGGGPGVTPETLTAPDQGKTDLRAPDQADGGFQPTQDLRAPDQVDGGFKPSQTPPGMPTWPLNPTPIVGQTAQPTATKPADDGLSTWAIVLIAVGGVVVVATAGLGLSRRKRVKTA
ncbi:MAG TPA: hypothetical protein VH834_17500 [Solirubrobacteraceae bacterium]|jgi:hypothetical protein